MSLYTDASLIMYPSGVKASKIYSQKPTNGSGDLTFTRASTATRVNSIGLIEAVASNVPRIDYTSGGCGKLLLEPQRTNLVTDSSNCLAAINGGVLTNNAGTSPDGTVTADKVTFGSGVNDGALIALTASVTGSTTYQLTFYAKSVVGDGTFDVRIDTNTTPLLVNQNITATTEWVRYTISVTTDSGATAITSNTRLRALTASNEILFWGFQFELGTYPTSIIPTAGSTVTRLADAASVTVPSGTLKITETFGDDTTNVITSIPATYTATVKPIKHVIMSTVL